MKNTEPSNYNTPTITYVGFNGYKGSEDNSLFPINHLFVTKHGFLPSCFNFGNWLHIDSKTFNKFISENKKRVLANNYHFGASNNYLDTILFYFDYKNNPVYIIFNAMEYGENPNYEIKMYFKLRDNKVNRFIKYFKDNKVPEKKQTGLLNILIEQNSAFSLKSKSINPPQIDFSLNYNEDFKPINDLIIDRLSEKEAKGLVLLHGNPGTGKTTYIRYLINNLNKRIIYIPPSMANSLSNPHLIHFLMEYSDSILIIEDAENVLTKRQGGSSQAISNILNLSDGLLSDCLNMQIVATFNTNICNIDEALLRKGRLIAKYEFKPLEKDRALALSQKLGLELNGQHTLADIYNAKSKSFSDKKNNIGFQLQNN